MDEDNFTTAIPLLENDPAKGATEGDQNISRPEHIFQVRAWHRFIIEQLQYGGSRSLTSPYDLLVKQSPYNTSLNWVG